MLIYIIPYVYTYVYTYLLYISKNEIIDSVN